MGWALGVNMEGLRGSTRWGLACGGRGGCHTPLAAAGVEIGVGGPTAWNYVSETFLLSWVLGVFKCGHLGRLHKGHVPLGSSGRKQEVTLRTTSGWRRLLGKLEF
jgi:hypothetical protein